MLVLNQGLEARHRFVERASGTINISPSIGTETGNYEESESRATKNSTKCDNLSASMFIEERFPSTLASKRVPVFA